MKRLSYVMPYCEQGGAKKSTLKQAPEQKLLKPKNSVTPHTIRTGIHTSHFKTIADSQKVTHQRLRKSVCIPKQSYEKPIENEARIPLPLRVDSSKELREALEAWQAANGRSLKRPRSVLPSSSRAARKRRHTMQVLPPTEQRKDSQHVWPHQHDGQEAVVSCSQANVPGISDGNVVQRLDFDGAGHGQQQLEETTSLADQLDHTPPPRRRRTCVHFVDDAMVFGSTAIKYSRLRSDRRRTVATPNEPIGTIFVTPVRRSTRKNKSTLGVELDKAVCFDSPSDLCIVDNTCIVKVVPNLALLFGNS
eukprot:Em0022g745a